MKYSNEYKNQNDKFYRWFQLNNVVLAEKKNSVANENAKIKSWKLSG